MQMPFGKYKGVDLADIPTDYLEWLSRECNLRWPLNQAVREELCGRTDSAWYEADQGFKEEDDEKHEVEDVSAIEDVITRWYRELSLRWHPDRGGTTEAMQAVNDAHTLLRELIAEAKMGGMS